MLNYVKAADQIPSETVKSIALILQVRCPSLYNRWCLPLTSLYTLASPAGSILIIPVFGPAHEQGISLLQIPRSIRHWDQF